MIVLILSSISIILLMFLIFMYFYMVNLISLNEENFDKSIKLVLTKINNTQADNSDFKKKMLENLNRIKSTSNKHVDAVHVDPKYVENELGKFDQIYTKLENKVKSSKLDQDKNLTTFKNGVKKSNNEFGVKFNDIRTDFTALENKLSLNVQSLSENTQKYNTLDEQFTILNSTLSDNMDFSNKNERRIFKLEDELSRTTGSNLEKINSLKVSVNELLKHPNFVDEEEININERIGCKNDESITRCCKINMYKGSQEVIDNNYSKITVHYLGPNINETIEFELRCMYNISDLENKEVDVIKNADSVTRVNRTETRAQLSIRKNLPKLISNSIITVIVGPYIPSLEIDAIYAVPLGYNT